MESNVEDEANRTRIQITTDLEASNTLHFSRKDHINSLRWKGIRSSGQLLEGSWEGRYWTGKEEYYLVGASNSFISAAECTSPVDERTRFGFDNACRKQEELV
jgi:hypothetical protein